MIKTFKNKRAELGAVIDTHRNMRNIDMRTALDMVSASSKVWDAWLAGEGAPDSKQWGKLTNILHRGLSNYRPLYHEARREHEAAVRHQPVATLGDKLGDIKLPKAALEWKPPAAVGDDFLLKSPGVEVVPEEPRVRFNGVQFNVGTLPKGWRTAEAVTAREDFARDMYRQDQYLPAYKVVEAQRAKFGVSTTKARLVVIQAEIQTEIQQAKKYKSNKLAAAALEAALADRPTLPEGPVVVVQPAPAPKAPSVEEQVSTGIQMILEAIPNLAQLTVLVDAQGRASVDYSVRVTVQETGSFTLGGK